MIKTMNQAKLGLMTLMEAIEEDGGGCRLTVSGGNKVLQVRTPRHGNLKFEAPGWLGLLAAARNAGKETE